MLVEHYVGVFLNEGLVSATQPAVHISALASTSCTLDWLAGAISDRLIMNPGHCSCYITVNIYFSSKI